jgi:LEA14-like dessication related protein
MKMKNLLLFLGAGAIAYFLIRKKRLATVLQYSIEAISIKGTKIFLKLGLLNPTGTPANFNSFVGTFFIKGTQVATVENFNKTRIAPNSKTTIDFTISPSGLGILQTISKLLKKGGLKNLSAQLKGTANVDSVNFPVDITYSV